ncbi:MAG TPA: hypothetical protein VEO95_07095, partial [Chthoniobacteraceae bacterium]|nr:hypothetical protein [Chthoniobacteraceae bacterium]
LRDEDARALRQGDRLTTRDARGWAIAGQSFLGIFVHDRDDAKEGTTDHTDYTDKNSVSSIRAICVICG